MPCCRVMPSAPGQMTHQWAVATLWAARPAEVDVHTTVLSHPRDSVEWLGEILRSGGESVFREPERDGPLRRCSRPRSTWSGLRERSPIGDGDLDRVAGERRRAPKGELAARPRGGGDEDMRSGDVGTPRETGTPGDVDREEVVCLRDIGIKCSVPAGVVKVCGSPVPAGVVTVVNGNPDDDGRRGDSIGSSYSIESISCISSARHRSASASLALLASESSSISLLAVS